MSPPSKKKGSGKQSSSVGEGQQQDVTVFRDDQTVYRADTQPPDTQPSDNVTDMSAGQSQEQLVSELEAQDKKILKARFVLEEQIGSGGMGSVFRAKDLRKVEARDSKPYLAVKVLNNNFRKHPEAFVALEREASKSQQLRHSNIVSIFDFDKDADTPFITMELLEGHELAEVLNRYPNGIPQELAWSIIRGMVTGLRHAHEEGVVHADFKPSNVYITNKQETKILDFGIARAMRLNQSEPDTDFDPTKLAALTPAYASREMLQGDNAEPRDDLYSLGVVIYMVLTGLHPYGRVPAREAARENLKPERIKQLSRRQWRIVEQCLSFNRQDRPECADSVYDALFNRASWQKIALAGVASMVLLGAGLVASNFVQRVEIDEVKQEVRTETLMYAQVQRIDDLLLKPGFDAEWIQSLFSELQMLRTVAPRSAANEAMAQRVGQAFAVGVKQSLTHERAFQIFNQAQQFEYVQASRAYMQERLVTALQQLVTQKLDGPWIAQAEQILGFTDVHFAESNEMQEAKNAVMTHLAEEIVGIADSESDHNVRVAELAWQTFGHEWVDENVRLGVGSDVALARQGINQRSAAAQAREVVQSLHNQLDTVLNVSCLRLDLGLIGGELDVVEQQHPQHFEVIRSRAASKISNCVKRLGALDPDRGLSLLKQARARLGELGQFAQQGVDPCAMHYLVGNGRQMGPGGSCVDALEHPSQENLLFADDVLQGPRLVVVGQPHSDRKFAISKYEISWRLLAQFCQSAQTCESLEVPQKSLNLPAAGLTILQIEQFAQWLSDKSGYQYRLPTKTEWLQVAQGDPDPNRNCRIDLVSPRGGDKPLEIDAGAVNAVGLVHVLGNVQELVADEGGFVALGGTYRDTIDECIAATTRPMRHPRSEPVDAQTGFRLVREVS